MYQSLPWRSLLQAPRVLRRAHIHKARAFLISMIVVLLIFFSSPPPLRRASVAVVFPVTEENFSHLIYSIAHRYVLAGPPCRSSLPIDFLVYFPRPTPLAATAVTTLARALGALGRTCHVGISVLCANLTEEEDGYPQGVNAQFYHLYHTTVVQQYRSFFWAESDVFPVKPFWLERIFLESQDCFLVKGSLFLGNDFNEQLQQGRAEYWEWLPHINGNALWATVKLLPDVQELIRSCINDPAAFDVAVFQHIFRLPTIQGHSFMKKYAHLYKYSRFIQNWFTNGSDMFHSQPWNQQNLDTVLVHASRSLPRRKEQEANTTAASYIHTICSLGCVPNVSKQPLYNSSTRLLIAFVDAPHVGVASLRSYLSCMRSPCSTSRLLSPGMIDLPRLQSWTPKEFDFVDSIAGEYIFRPFLTESLNLLPWQRITGRPIVWITILRDPFERVLGHYNYVHNATSDTSAKRLARLSFEQFVEKSANAVSRLLGLDGKHSWTDDAIHNFLREIFAVIGVREQYATFAVTLLQYLNLPAPPQNLAWLQKEKPCWFQPNIEQAELIRISNTLDYRVYRIAQKLSEEQTRALASRSVMDEYLMRMVRTPTALGFWEFAWRAAKGQNLQEESKVFDTSRPLVVASAPALAAGLLQCDTIVTAKQFKHVRELEKFQVVCGSLLLYQKRGDLPYVGKWSRENRTFVATVFDPIAAMVVLYSKQNSTLSLEDFVSTTQPNLQTAALFGLPMPTNDIPELSNLLRAFFHVTVAWNFSLRMPASVEHVLKVPARESTAVSEPLRRVIDLYHAEDRRLYEAALLASTRDTNVK